MNAQPAAAPPVRYTIPQQAPFEVVINRDPLQLRGDACLDGVACPQRSFVYFLQGRRTRLIKIGLTTGGVRSRLRAIASASPDSLILVGLLVCADPHAVEGALHHYFSASRAHGEWFRPTAGVKHLIERETMTLPEVQLVLSRPAEAGEVLPGDKLADLLRQLRSPVPKAPTSPPKPLHMRPNSTAYKMLRSPLAKQMGIAISDEG